jgi:hypothetical protein
MEDGKRHVFGAYRVPYRANKKYKWTKAMKGHNINFKLPLVQMLSSMTIT